MSTTITFNGVSYSLPGSGETDWAAALNALLTSLAANAPPRASAGAAVLMFGAGSTPINTATNLLRPGFVTAAADTTAIYLRAPFAGRVSSLYVQCGTAAAGGTTALFARKNGQAQALTCSFAAGVTQGSDIVNEFTVAAGDTIGLTIAHGVSIATGHTNVVATMKLTLA